MQCARRGCKRTMEQFAWQNLIGSERSATDCRRSARGRGGDTTGPARGGEVGMDAACLSASQPCRRHSVKPFRVIYGLSMGDSRVERMLTFKKTCVAKIKGARPRFCAQAHARELSRGTSTRGCPSPPPTTTSKPASGDARRPAAHGSALSPPLVLPGPHTGSAAQASPVASSPLRRARASPNGHTRVIYCRHATSSMPLVLPLRTGTTGYSSTAAGTAGMPLPLVLAAAGSTTYCSCAGNTTVEVLLG